MVNILEYLSLKYRFVMLFKQYRETENILKTNGKWNTSREISPHHSCPYHSCKNNDFETLFYEIYGFTKGYFDWNDNSDNKSDTSELSLNSEELVECENVDENIKNSDVFDIQDIPDDEIINMIYQYKKSIYRRDMTVIKPVIFIDTHEEKEEKSDNRTKSLNNSNCGYKAKKKTTANYYSDMSDEDY